MATTPAEARAASGTKAFVLLGLILLLGAGLRFWQIDSASLWLDEYLTVVLSNGHGFSMMDLPSGRVIEAAPDYVSLAAARPWTSIWTMSAGDVHPPLFYLILRGWREVVPDSDFWIRALPAILSLLAIVALYFAIEVQAGPTPALWACLIMALSGLQIEYAQECRSYPLLILCLLIAAVGLLRIRELGFNWRRGGLLGLGALSAAMTHYLAFPSLIIMTIYALGFLRGRDRLLSMLSIVLAGAVFCGIWAPWALEQGNGFWGKIAFTKRAEWSIGLTVLDLLRVPLKFLINVPTVSTPLLSLAAAWFVVPALLLRRNRALWFWWLWLTLGLAAVIIGDVGRGGRLLEIIRYTLALSPALYALAAIMLAHCRGWRRHVLPALVCVACVVALPGAYLRYKQDWRSMGQYMAGNVHPDDILVLYEPESDAIAWRIRCDVIGMQYYNRSLRVPIVILNTPPTAEVEQRIRSARSVWCFASSRPDLQAVFPGASISEQYGADYTGTISRLRLADHQFQSSPPRN